MSEQVITSLAILKVNWDEKHDYIDNFVPFVAECLRIAPQAEVSLPELQDSITRTFGLIIPQGVLSTVLNRAAKPYYNYVKKTAGIYRRNDDTLSTLNVEKTRNDVLRKHEALVNRLIEFCKTQYQVNWSHQEAENTLLAYLQLHAARTLATVVDGQLITSSLGSGKQIEFLVSAFIKHLYESDPEGFEFLETIVKGSMLADVLLYPNISEVAQRFERVEVYFDTQFLLRALGLAGRSLQAPCRELIDLLYELNADLRCFEHTLVEIRNVLKAAEQALLNRERFSLTYGETVEYLIDSRYQASDVELTIARLERSLRNMHVQVKAAPPLTAPLGLDEKKFESILEEEVRYPRKEALLHDLNSLTAVHRLRHGRLPYRLEACNSIFITTNSSLAKASIRFFKEEYGDVPVPHCMVDHFFTTLVWLKKPLKAPNLPRNRIVANCYAALNPSGTLWKKYLEEINRLRQQESVSEDDFYVLRFSVAARNALMDITLGDPEVFTKGTIEEVLKKAQAAVCAEAERSLEGERKKRLEAEERAALAEAQLERARQARLQRFQDISVYVGRWVSRAVLYGGTALMALALYSTFPKPFPALPSIFAEWKILTVPATLFILCLFGFLTIANLSFGVTLRSLVRRLEVFISRFIEQTLIRWFTEPPHDVKTLSSPTK